METFLTQVYHRLPEIEAENPDLRGVWGLHLPKSKLLSALQPCLQQAGFMGTTLNPQLQKCLNLAQF